MDGSPVPLYWYWWPGDASSESLLFELTDLRLDCATNGIKDRVSVSVILRTLSGVTPPSLSQPLTVSAHPLSQNPDSTP